METEDEGVATAPVSDVTGAEAANGAYQMDGMKDELEYLDNIPKAIIFTNLPDAVFDKAEINPVKVG